MPEGAEVRSRGTIPRLSVTPHRPEACGPSLHAPSRSPPVAFDPRCARPRRRPRDRPGRARARRRSARTTPQRRRADPRSSSSSGRPTVRPRSYRDYADAAYAEAIKLHAERASRSTARTRRGPRSRTRPSGRRSSSTSATATAGPARTPTTRPYTTKDGFGLNATAGNGDGNNKYYGEPYVATLDLAPNAIVLLHHLCYASGNSEPGHAAPSLTDAKQRVDNYGAGFLRDERPGRPRRRPPRAGRLPAGDLHDRPDHRAAVARRRRAPTATSSRSRRPGPRAPRPSWTPSRRRPASTGRSIGDPAADDQRDHRRVHRPGSSGPQGRRRADLRRRHPVADTAAVVAPVAVLPATTRLKVLETVVGFGDDAVFRVEGLDDPSRSPATPSPATSTRATAGRPPSSSTSGGGGKTYSAAAKGTHTLSGTLQRGRRPGPSRSSAATTERSRPARAAARRSAWRGSPRSTVR